MDAVTMKELRRQLRLTQEQLADRAKLSAMTVSRIERGVTIPRPSTIQLIELAILDVQSEQIKQVSDSMVEGMRP